MIPSNNILNAKELDIKLGQFMQELDLVLRKIKIGKLQGLMKCAQKYERQGNSMTYCSDTATPYITQTQ